MRYLKTKKGGYIPETAINEIGGRRCDGYCYVGFGPDASFEDVSINEIDAMRESKRHVIPNSLPDVCAVLVNAWIDDDGKRDSCSRMIEIAGWLCDGDIGPEDCTESARPILAIGDGEAYDLGEVNRRCQGNDEYLQFMVLHNRKTGGVTLLYSVPNMEAEYTNLESFYVAVKKSANCHFARAKAKAEKLKPVA